MVPRRQHAAAAGQFSRRLFLCGALLLMGASVPSAADDRRVTVTEADGVYRVVASFAVAESPDDVIAVLTDYERIPKYLPDVEVSRVIRRTPESALVEQQAVSKFMLFSKRVHLILDVREGAGTVRFSDRCGKSFAVYEGEWLVTQHDSVTVVDYALSAKPSFDVPALVLRRLLKRDAADLIDRIKEEIAARAIRRH
jgi:hypothetical protein